MADISADIAQWSATAGSNSPGGSTAIGTGLDDNLRAIQAAIVAALNAKGSDIASASSIDLSATNGLFHDITGTTAITSLGTVRAGVWKVLKFEGALTLTHNATSLILPGGANITTADGDIAMVVSEGSGNWRCAFYIKKSSIPVVLGSISAAGDIWQATAANVMARLGIGTAGQVLNVNSGATAAAWSDRVTLNTAVATTSGTAVTISSTIPSWANRLTLNISGLSSSGTQVIKVQLGTGGAATTSGYVGSAFGCVNGGSPLITNPSDGFVISPDSAGTYTRYGTVVFTRLTGNTWIANGNGGQEDTARWWGCGGEIALAGALDFMRITADGVDTFDAGSVSLMWE